MRDIGRIAMIGGHMRWDQIEFMRIVIRVAVIGHRYVGSREMACFVVGRWSRRARQCCEVAVCHLHFAERAGYGDW